MKEENNDNRDVIQIFATIYSFIKRYFIILILVIICGIIIGVIKGKSESFHYKKHITLNSIVVHKEVSIDMVKSLKILVNSNNNDALARKMNIPEDAAASIISIDTSTFRNKYLNIGFAIDLTFSDIRFADTLSAGILHFFNNNDYYKKQINLYLREKKAILDNITSVISAGITTDANNNAPAPSVNPLMTKNSAGDAIRLLEKKYDVEKDIEFGKEITIVEETQGKIPTGIGLIKSVILYGLAFTVLAVVITLFIESLRLTKPYLRRK